MSSIFSSATTQLAARIESMKGAETALMSFANRFKDLNDDHGYRGIEAETHILDIFDTKIPRSAVPLKMKTKCQIKYCKNDINEDDDHLVIHGIKVTSNIYKQNHQNASDSTDESPLVILHGYMNGAPYFYRNLLGLSNYAFAGQVYALDMLGWGLSSRPKFQVTSKGDEKDDTYAAEQVFVESLKALEIQTSTSCLYQ